MDFGCRYFGHIGMTDSNVTDDSEPIDWLHFIIELELTILNSYWNLRCKTLWRHYPCGELAFKSEMASTLIETHTIRIWIENTSRVVNGQEWA